jgi:hypothetical protein
LLAVCEEGPRALEQHAQGGQGDDLQSEAASEEGWQAGEPVGHPAEFWLKSR